MTPAQLMQVCMRALRLSPEQIADLARHFRIAREAAR